MFCKKCGSLTKLGNCSMGCKDPYSENTEESAESKKIDETTLSKIEEIIDQINKGFVFAELPKLESALEKVPKNYAIKIKKCISDIKGGIYVSFSCSNREKPTFISVYGGLRNIKTEYTFDPLKISCKHEAECYRRKEPYYQTPCEFKGSWRKIQNAKDLIKIISD